MWFPFSCQERETVEMDSGLLVVGATVFFDAFFSQHVTKSEKDDVAPLFMCIPNKGQAIFLVSSKKYLEQSTTDRVSISYIKNRGRTSNTGKK